MDIQAYIQSGIIESYVLGMATDEEIAEVEQLQTQYPEIEKAIDDFANSLEEQAMANAVAPPSDLKQKIMNSLSINNETTTTPLTAVTETKEQKIPLTPIRSISSIWRTVAAASLIALVASIASTIYFYTRYTNTSERYQALLIESQSLQANNNIYETKLRDWQTASNMMADPNMAVVKMPGIKGKEENLTTVFWHKTTKEVYVLMNKLPSAPTNKQYQLWALVDGKPVDAGMIDESNLGICKMKNIPNAQAFAITLENKGGSPTPTMEQMFVMGTV